MQRLSCQHELIIVIVLSFDAIVACQGRLFVAAFFVFHAGKPFEDVATTQIPINHLLDKKVTRSRTDYLVFPVKTPYFSPIRMCL